jgi:predicted RNA-binding Zn ribbon-like protein
VSEHRFLLVGGHPVLDFVNTIHDWTVPEPRDYLATVDDALRFGAVTNLLSTFEARRLRAEAGSSELRRLRELRARLERIFRSLSVARAPLAEDLAALARDAADAARATTLHPAHDRIERSIDPAAAGSAILRWRIAEGAIALLTSDTLRRLKTCPACGWFFLDSSKNSSRRWCSMATCGSTSKAHRYYWRTKTKGHVRRRPASQRGGLDTTSN